MKESQYNKYKRRKAKLSYVYRDYKGYLRTLRAKPKLTVIDLQRINEIKMMLHIIKSQLQDLTMQRHRPKRI